MLIKICLGQEEFRKLTSGKEVNALVGGHEVAIILEDLGWVHMHQIVALSEVDRNIKKMGKGGGANG